EKKKKHKSKNKTKQKTLKKKKKKEKVKNMGFCLPLCLIRMEPGTPSNSFLLHLYFYICS
ncbi:hypothetical protein P7M16_23695, partial [Vibrio parahaemolyticus]|nr:hypothetical protein [Vibrio parahaemolyticus]